VRQCAGGDYGANVQASDWAGHAVAAALGLDASDKPDKARISSLLAVWIKTGALVRELRRDGKKGRDRPFVVVGDWIDPASLPTPKSGVGTGGGSGENRSQNLTPPHPLSRGGYSEPSGYDIGDHSSLSMRSKR
jgi:hypothetical protein